MAQNNKLNQHYTNLNDLVVPENWMEITGPFYHIKTENKKIIGPFHAHDIAALLEVTNVSDDTFIKDAKNTSGWSPIYSHPVFQRRKPSLVTEITNIQASTFYYLKNGSPVGPVTPTEMELLIKDRNVISTDAVSIDDGKTWLKLYQVPGFDQRSYSASELPIIPESNEEDFDLNNYNEDNESSQMANLVYIESRKSKDQTIETNNLNTDTKTSSKTGLIIMFTILLFAIIGYFTQSKVSIVDKQKTEIETQEAKEIKNVTTQEEDIKRKPVKAVTVPVSTQKKNTQKRTQELKTRKPTSFTSTPIYKDRKKMKDNALEEDSYYDDGEGNIENDAVRKAVSRETLYPEDSEVLEPESIIEEDIYSDEVDAFDSADNEITSAEDIWGEEKPAKKEKKDPFYEEY